MTDRASPDLTIVVPYPPGVAPNLALRSLARTAGNLDIQVLVVEGRQPSWQRNLAVQSARGKVVLFLDHDSEVLPGALKAHLAAMRDPRVGVAGGPNVSSGREGRFGRLAGLVFGSPLGSPLVWRRYRGGTGTNNGDEKSLILCNLSVRRAAFLDCGGFDPRLYPNEENEMINRLQRRGWRAAYSPRMVVAKARPSRLLDYTRENARNGRGRLEQAWINPHRGDAIFLAALVGGAAGVAAAGVTGPLPWLAAYGALTGVEGLRLSLSRPAGCRNRALATAVGCAVLIALRHAAYFGGMVAGALTGWRKRKLRFPPLRMLQREYRMRGRKMVAARRVAIRQGGQG